MLYWRFLSTLIVGYQFVFVSISQVKITEHISNLNWLTPIRDKTPFFFNACFIFHWILRGTSASSRTKTGCFAPLLNWWTLTFIVMIGERHFHFNNCPTVVGELSVDQMSFVQLTYDHINVPVLPQKDCFTKVLYASKMIIFIFFEWFRKWKQLFSTNLNGNHFALMPLNPLSSYTMYYVRIIN